MKLPRNFWFITALCVMWAIYGCWAKVTHQPYGYMLFRVGMLSLIVPAVMYIYLKVSSSRKKNKWHR